MDARECRICGHRHVCRFLGEGTKSEECRYFRKTRKNDPIGEKEDFETILICAERYACGRQTYMPVIVTDFITPLIPTLSRKALTVIRNDITAMQEHHSLGDPKIDAPMWKDLRRLINEELNRRAEEE